MVDVWLTPPELVDVCIDAVKTHIPGLSARLIVEPSAGMGAFLTALVKNDIKNIRAYDIDPSMSCPVTNYIYMDFLQEIKPFPPGTVVLGNPPFSNGFKRGTGSGPLIHLAFLKKSVELGCEYIAFILPNSFSRPTKKCPIPETLEIVKVIPLKPIFSRGKVLTSFFILKKRIGDIQKRIKITTDGLPFSFVTPYNKDPNVFLIKRFSSHKKIGYVVYGEEANVLIENALNKWSLKHPMRKMTCNTTFFHILPKEASVINIFKTAFENGSWLYLHQYSTSKTNVCANREDCINIFIKNR